MCLLVAVAAMLAIGAAPASAVSRDRVVLAGGETLARGETADNVFVVDGPVRIAGRVTGDVVAVHGPVTISGMVDGTVTAVTKSVHVLPGARIGGDLLYGGPKPTIAPGALVQGKVSDEGWVDISTTGAAWILRVLWWVTAAASTLALGLALVLLFPRVPAAAVKQAAERPGEAAAWAAGLFFGVPFAAAIAMGTLFGFPLGIGLILALLPAAAVGYVTSAVGVGRLVLRRPDTGVKAFLVGWAILRAIALVPVLGMLTWIAASAFGLAVLLLAAWSASHPREAVAPGPGAPAPA